MDWIRLLAHLLMIVSSATIGFIFGKEYQRLRIQRAWRENRRRVAEAAQRAGEDARARLRGIDGPPAA